MVRLKFSIELNYEIDQPGCDFIFSVHAAQTRYQTVVNELLLISQNLPHNLYADTMTYTCCRRHVFDPGADFGLTHLNSWRIRLRKRFDRRSDGSMKSRQVGQNHVGANTDTLKGNNRISTVTPLIELDSLHQQEFDDH